MSRKKRVYEDDDGRTVADMSGVERPNLLSFRMPPEWKAKKEPAASENSGDERPWESTELTPAERRAVVWGAIRAAALIALTFIVAFGAVIFLMTKLL